MTTLQTIDAHVGGAPVRMITAGIPAVQGKTMLEKRAWLEQHAEGIRRALMLEPRGHADMSGALLTEPVSPGSHAGLLFMNPFGYAAISGHGIIAVTTIALERGLLVPGGDGRTVIYDTPAGTIRAAAAAAPRTTRRIERVVYTDVPAFVVQGGVEVSIGSRRLRADLAFGGEFYAIVDSESVGVPTDGAHLPELRRAAVGIMGALEGSTVVAHPLVPALRGIAGVVFTGPPGRETAALRTVTVTGDGQVDRSASGNATAAVMAVVDAMGLLGDDQPFVQEGILGTVLTGAVTSRTHVGEFPAIVTEIAGSAWITGDHTFIVDDQDPFAEGFRL